jgi:iron-sulfur cluster assembly accessory protein
MGSGGCCGGGGGCGSGGGGGCGDTETTTKELAPDMAAAFDATDSNPILMTDKAVEAIRAAIKEEGSEGDGLRVAVVGGGCSGYQYSLDFEKEGRIGDLTLDFSGLTVYVDPVSAGYLKGTTIDYITGLQGTGFKFINPNAKRTCGCGSSFS